MRTQEVLPVSGCFICGNTKLSGFLQLGPTPTPNAFLKPDRIHEPEKFYPLDICFCGECGMVQLAHIVNPQVMFHEYVYIPSTSKTMRDHFAGLARYAIEKATLKPGDRVMDIGSNDGCLLKNFLKGGMSVLGVDPAANLAKTATEEGVETINALFTRKTAEKIAAERGKARVILGTNVLAHVPDPHDFVEGVRTLLADDGLWIAEFPYLADMIGKTEFDTIYQEHLSYFGLTPILRLLQPHDMSLVHVDRLPVHGGSLRITVSKGRRPLPPAAQALLDAEQKKGLLKPETYRAFAKQVGTLRRELITLLWDLKQQGKRIVGYGAPAKGNVLLNYCRIGPETLDYIVDSIPYKQGRCTPGTHIPIYPESRLLEDQPDYALLLAWNFSDEIVQKQHAYRQKGGRFIMPIPTIKTL